MPDCGVSGLPPNAEKDDWGVRLPDGIGGVGGTGSRAGGGRGLILSPLGRERMLCSIDGRGRKAGMGGVF